MLAVRARQAAGTVIIDGHQLVQLVISQAFAADSSGAEAEAGNHQDRQYDNENPAAEKA